MKICLDAGHGGTGETGDTGAVGPHGLQEDDVALTICEDLARLLEKEGMEVKLTRTDDKFVQLAKRCHIANEYSADVFVSVHCNSNGPDAVGIETLYKSSAGQHIASYVQSALIEASGDRDRGLKHRNDLHVLNGTDMPAILVEVGFISHAPTESKLKTTDYQHTLAKAICQGLVEYLGLAK